MKKKAAMLLLAAMLACGTLAGCGDTEEVLSTNTTDVSGQETEAAKNETETAVEETETTEIEEVEENHDGMYRSELTNEWIDESLKDQRPVAVLVDNEKTALDHYGLTQADIVYEMMNSTANGEITRFMALVKDWGSITRFGSIRSARPTNFMIAPEYNAIVVHDGGPYYINAYLSNPWVDNLSGGFARIENGKPREFTEYVTTGELENRIAKAGYDVEYNEHYKGAHWVFTDEKNPVDLSEIAGSLECTLVVLPFPHNESELQYDEESGTYLYFEYGDAHIDPENDDKQLAFTNLLIQCTDYSQLDANGYMEFKVLNQSGPAYYITGGHAVQVTWAKAHDTDPTRYYDASGNEITINTGKIYVGFVPADRWDELVIE